MFQICMIVPHCIAFSTCRLSLPLNIWEESNFLGNLGLFKLAWIVGVAPLNWSGIALMPIGSVRPFLQHCLHIFLVYKINLFYALCYFSLLTMHLNHAKPQLPTHFTCLKFCTCIFFMLRSVKKAFSHSSHHCNFRYQGSEGFMLIPYQMHQSPN